MRVMIVEDDAVTARYLEEAVTEQGHQVVSAVGNVADAMARADTLQPDLALIDIRLRGDIDGLTLGAGLARRGVAVVYATGDAEMALKGGRSHALAVLAKPISAADLSKVLSRFAH